MEEKFPGHEALCRFCLSDAPPMQNIFEEGLSNKIIILSGLDVQSNDALPKCICRDCRWIVEKSFIFRMVAKQSDSRLRKHIRLVNQNKPSALLSKSYQDDDTQECEETCMESYKYFEEANEEILKLRNDFEAEKENIIQEEVDKAKSEFKAEFIAAQMTKNKFPTKKLPDNPVLLNKCAPSRQRFESSPAIRRKRIQVNKTEPVVDEIVIGDYEIEIMTQDEVEETQQVFDKITDVTEIEFLNEIELAEEQLEEIIESEEEYKPPIVTRKARVKSLPTVKVPSVRRKAIKVESCRKSTQRVAVKKDEIFEPVEASYFEAIENVNEKDLDENGEKKIFQCAFLNCTESFARRQTCKTHYFNHMASQTITNGYTCDFCQKAFKVSSALERHKRVHTGDKPFKCESEGCNKAFSQKEMLKRHIVIHLSIAPFACKICDKRFRQKEPLRQHINKVHSEDAEAQSYLFNCKICQKQFAHSSGLSRHLLIHSGRRFICEICNKVFNDQSALKRHGGVHKK